MNDLIKQLLKKNNKIGSFRELELIKSTRQSGLKTKSQRFIIVKNVVFLLISLLHFIQKPVT